MFTRKVLGLLMFFSLVGSTAWGQVNAYPYAESFDATAFPPTNWSVSHTSGTSDWTRGTANPHTGAGHAQSTNPAAGAEKRLDVAIDLSSETNAQLTYWMNRSSSTSDPSAVVLVQYSTDGTNFTTLRTINVESNLSDTYALFLDLLPSALNNQPQVTLRWAHTKTAGSSASVRLDDVEIITGGVVPVEMSVLTARVVEDGVLLEWSTESETENLGFHVYRSDHRGGEYRRLTAELIAGAGTSAERHRYSYLDGNAGKNSYYYKIADVDYQGNYRFHGPVQAAGASDGGPHKFNLEQNYPNPFQAATQFSYRLNTGGNVQLTIYNVLGQPVRKLINSPQAAGLYTLAWDGTDDRGVAVPAGTYFFELRAGEQRLLRKLVFMH